MMLRVYGDGLWSIILSDYVKGHYCGIYVEVLCSVMMLIEYVDGWSWVIMLRYGAVGLCQGIILRDCAKQLHWRAMLMDRTVLKDCADGLFWGIMFKYDTEWWYWLILLMSYAVGLLWRMMLIYYAELCWGGSEGLQWCIHYT